MQPKSQPPEAERLPEVDFPEPTLRASARARVIGVLRGCPDRGCNRGRSPPLPPTCRVHQELTAGRLGASCSSTSIAFPRYRRASSISSTEAAFRAPAARWDLWRECQFTTSLGAARGRSAPGSASAASAIDETSWRTAVAALLIDGGRLRHFISQALFAAFWAIARPLRAEIDTEQARPGERIGSAPLVSPATCNIHSRCRPPQPRHQVVVLSTIKS